MPSRAFHISLATGNAYLRSFDTVKLIRLYALHMLDFSPLDLLQYHALFTILSSFSYEVGTILYNKLSNILLGLLCI